MSGNPVVEDPLRSGAIFKMTRPSLSAGQVGRTPPPANSLAASSPQAVSSSPNVNIGASSSNSSNAASGLQNSSVPSGQFDPEYASRVRNRFNELYRSTPIPTSILYGQEKKVVSAATSALSSVSLGTETAPPAATSNNSTPDVSSSASTVKIPVKHIVAPTPGKCEFGPTLPLYLFLTSTLLFF
jgi:hypothetical protein